VNPWAYITARRERERLDREYVELRTEANVRLHGAIAVRELWPCEETGLLVAQAELAVHQVEAARRGDKTEVLSLQQAIENIAQILQGPRPNPRLQRQAEMRETAWLN
jgi:hypothetical protein